ncbi:hypothetical protein [Streptomyces sp. NPDC048419]|uniref:hypothetical protein n=1 Tax=Streptomyces sp. NPDC048419 TaxID=3365547 RepID=UPI003720DFDC
MNVDEPLPEFDDIAIEELDVAGGMSGNTTNCGGTVSTATCPFTVASGFCFGG